MKHGIRDKIFAPSALVPGVIADIYHNEARLFPDFSSVVILLPTLFSCADFRKFFSRHTTSSTLLPNVTTLHHWADNGVSKIPHRSDMFFISEIYGVLKKESWTFNQNLWVLASEIFSLFKEITSHATNIPDSEREFKQCFEDAFASVTLRPIEYEATLISNMWQAFWSGNLDSDNQVVDSEGAYSLRLRSLAANYTHPVYMVGLSDLTKVEHDFFNLYAKSARTYRYTIHGTMGKAIERENFYQYALISCFDSVSKDLYRDESSVGRLFKVNSAEINEPKILATRGLEDEAKAVTSQVLFWISEGLENIAIVGLDNLTARRVRALLEREQIFLQDELGWLLSTTSASTVILRWVEACTNDFNHESLLDLIKSPFLVHKNLDKELLLSQLGEILRTTSVRSCIKAYLSEVKKLDESENTEVFLNKLELASIHFRKQKNNSLSVWLDHLEKSLKALGIAQRLMIDSAGRQIMDLLRRHQTQLGSSQDQFSVFEWIQWLKFQFESNEFYDSEVVSPIVLTKLDNSKIRFFEAVVLVGCDTNHLPGKHNNLSVLGNSVRSELGLPGDSAKVKAIGENLVWLLSLRIPITFTWQQQKDGNPNGLSPILEMLDLQKTLLGGRTLILQDNSPYFSNVGTSPESCSHRSLYQESNFSDASSVALPTQFVPTKISSSGYASLLNCPFQYYSRYVLSLSPSLKIDEDLNKNDFGRSIHNILYQFHKLKISVNEDSRKKAEIVFRSLIANELKKINCSYLVRLSWTSDFEKIIEKYLDWQIKREKNGWNFFSGEVSCEKTILIDSDKTLTLSGIIDRIDRKSKDEYSLIDYKTTQFVKLRKFINSPDEFTQLLFYVSLVSNNLLQASYLGLNKGSIQLFDIEEDIKEFSEKNIDRLKTIFSMLYQGKSMPANGSEASCNFCEMRGLCRKDFKENNE